MKVKSLDGYESRRIAVVGLGPRGVGALEALANLAGERGMRVSLDLFDPHPSPGAGPNFDPDESDLCRLNIPMRDIDLRAPAALQVASLSAWLEPPIGRDSFPPRARLGTYLQYRLEAVSDAPALEMTRIAAQVTHLEREGQAWFLKTDTRRHGPYSEVLLVPGQPATRPDDQLAAWQAHAARGHGTLAQAYPVRRLVQQGDDWAGKTVAVRGFALSSFDVIRALTMGAGGRFTGAGYQPSGREPRCIVPFSLDGHPPYPKPATEEVDARFEPTPDETDAFREAVTIAACASPNEARQRLTAALIPPVERTLMTQAPETAPDSVADWLATEWSDAGVQEVGTALDCVSEGIAMAEGTRPPTIGYVVGQVWRKWQDPLRQGYNPAETAPVTPALIVGFDEGLKRYSYGPPVAACRELLSLIECGLVSTGLSHDPDIALIDEGWRLASAGREVTAEVMIDAVLPSPDPHQVTDSLISGLIHVGWLTTLDDLAARTGPDGLLIGSDDRVVPGLSLLGRLALGSVVAADSLHDCFGAASRRWAEGALSRIADPAAASVNAVG